MHSPDARRRVTVAVNTNLTSVAAQEAALHAVFAEFGPAPPAGAGLPTAVNT
ncbi:MULTISPECIES: hypothetical protein [Saccharothrix]|uniref:hypothetical protein n=1 Tax=Saccharothrix TaxID=2071 RepID=UPI0013014390|nr:hypothetical protein [Saccharothrix sp. CB00851]